MPDDNKPDQPQFDEDTFRNLVLLTLPWLSFQRDVLDIVRKHATDTSQANPAENLVLRQFQALMMILDPSRALRNSLDGDFEKKIEDAYKEILPKVSSAFVQLIEAQDAILHTLSDTLNTLRKADRPNNRSNDSN